MAEPIFNRVRRLITSKTEDTLDWLEASNPASILRGALRDMDKSIATLEQARGDAFGKRTLAERLEKDQREQARKMGDNARFAQEKGREDLARAALAEQIALEAAVKTQQALQREATDRITAIDANIADVLAERAEMKKRLAHVEAERARKAADPLTDRDAVSNKVAGTINNARETFDRVAALAGSPLPPADSKVAQQVDELSDLQRDAEINQRLAALAKQPAAKATKGRTSKA